MSDWKISEWLTVAAAFVTAGVVCWQSYETRRAATAANASAKAALLQAELQTTAMKQWVDVRATKLVDTGSFRNPVTWEDRVSANLEMHFEIVNRTPYPLTFQQAHVMMTHLGIEQEFVFRCAKDVRLIPGNGKGSSVGFLLKLQLSPDVMKWYRASGKLLFTVVGDIRFLPALGPPEVQGFGFLAEPATGDGAELPMIIEMTQDHDDPIQDSGDV